MFPYLGSMLHIFMPVRFIINLGMHICVYIFFHREPIVKWLLAYRNERLIFLSQVLPSVSNLSALICFLEEPN